MNKELGITIPCHWDLSVLKSVTEGNVGAITRVSEMYGVLADGGPVGHGRSPDSVVSVDRELACKFRERCESEGIEFTYLLNAPFNFNSDPQLTNQVDGYLDWIVNCFGAKSVTISSYELMTHVRQRYPDLQIHVSTIAGIRSRVDMEKYLSVEPRRIVPHHDLGKNWDELSAMIDMGEKFGIKIELLATESCLYNCPQRDAHYKHLGQKAKDNPFHVNCNSKKLEQPGEFLLAGGVIRPEDVQFFADMGVHRIKISGRSKPAEWLPEVVGAYQQNLYHGNLVRLLGIDPSLEAEEWIHIENDALDGFLRAFPQNNLPEARSYCDNGIFELWKNGDFYLSDGTSYREDNGRLLLDTLGKRASSIFNK